VFVGRIRMEGLEIVAASPGKEEPQELRPAEAGRNALAAVRLAGGFVGGALMASFVFPALKRRTVPADCGRWPHPDSALWLDVRAEHGLALPGEVLCHGRDRRFAVRACRELFLEAFERV
jgi:hypothetical protein